MAGKGYGCSTFDGKLAQKGAVAWQDGRNVLQETWVR